MIHVRKTFGKSWLFEGWRYAWVCRGNLLIYVAIYRTEREREGEKQGSSYPWQLECTVYSLYCRCDLYWLIVVYGMGYVLCRSLRRSQSTQIYIYIYIYRERERERERERRQSVH